MLYLEIQGGERGDSDSSSQDSLAIFVLREILLWRDFYNKSNNEVKLILTFYPKKNVIKVKGSFLKNAKCVKVTSSITFDWY